MMASFEGTKRKVTLMLKLEFRLTIEDGGAKGHFCLLEVRLCKMELAVCGSHDRYEAMDEGVDELKARDKELWE